MKTERTTDQRGDFRPVRPQPEARRFGAPRARTLAVTGLVLTLAAMAPSAQTIQLADQPGTPAGVQVAGLEGVGIDQTKLNNQVPLDLPFVDEQGKDVTIGQYFGKRPVVLALVYFDCPMLCSLVQNALSGTLAILKPTAGTDFEVVVASINPAETPAQAADAKAKMVTLYRRPGTDDGLHFLTGRESSIKALADAVGFRYKYDPKIAQFAHPAAIMVLTPDARVSRYLFGIDYGATDLRLALDEAAGGHIGNVVDQTLLFCYHYDPATGRYSLAIMSLIRLGGILTVLGIVLSIVLTVRRQRRQASAVAHTAGVH